MFKRMVMTRWLVLSPLLLLAACQAHVRTAAGAGPLGDQSEIFVYLEALPPEAERLSFAIGHIAAVSADGTEIPLELRIPAVARSSAAGARLLAWGRVPPGRYDGFAIHVASATLAGDDGPAALLVPKEPAAASFPFSAERGQANVAVVSLRYPPSVEQSFRFDASFVARAPERTVPDAVALCPNARMASVSVLDRRSRRVTAVIPTGGSPRAVAIDRGARRAYVAVAEEDEIRVLDLASGTSLARVQLSPGDRPWDVALAPDGRTLVVANRGSNSASFVDAVTLSELHRVPTGEAPSALLLDREGRRAYVLDLRSNDITVLDVANRAVVATVGTDAEPLRAAIDAAGRRLYVVHAGSPYVTVLSLPDLAPAGRVFVGLGARTILVDSRTDLVYVGFAGERRLNVYDPYALAPVSWVDVPAPVDFMTIDDAENALWALMPEVRAIAVLDLTTHELLARIDVGDGPATLALTGAR
jgi:YVTN family beta-propeller protein